MHAIHLIGKLASPLSTRMYTVVYVYISDEAIDSREPSIASALLYQEKLSLINEYSGG